MFVKVVHFLDILFLLNGGFYCYYSPFLFKRPFITEQSQYQLTYNYFLDNTTKENSCMKKIN